ncbi:hypothetical protein [Vibrio ziniensis]|uniref:Uncharacterized protein n=1 Tax=Vibrio ziniensis TaxID=2711221 RepID=A0A6G7CJ03_9VIBR|nr:hypothetical protein [Vibrio ziniensis]QIH42050.1 hypothetical protein G5S32_08605 [Vibrio ziniensis]
MLVNNLLESESKTVSKLSNSHTKLKNTFCAEVNCTNKYTRQVMVKSKNADCPNDQSENIFQIPLCQHHYENFHNPIELENDIQVIPTGFDQN